jgi:hypothetical protein
MQLRVEFAGLCLYLVHSNRTHVAVLLPDCRIDEANDPRHVDGTLGAAHVGYIRFDAANINFPPDPSAEFTGLPMAEPNEEGPAYEVIRRLNHETIRFVYEPTERASEKLEIKRLVLPDLDRFATTLRVRKDLFDRRPPQSLLAKTIIMGGELESQRGMARWQMPNTLAPDLKEVQVDSFAGAVVWTTELASANVWLEITKFPGSKARPVRIPLIPRDDGVISAKVANLCDKNPLEWPELRLHNVIEEDRDFKWLYRLLEPKMGREWETLLRGSRLPVPIMTQEQPQGDDDCTGLKHHDDFPTDM